jgi:hypothetical protein
MITYEVFSIEEAIHRKLPDSGYLRSDDWGQVLYRCEDGTPIHRVWADGCMEPEDARLCRDLSDFVAELKWLASRHTT